MNLTIYYKYTIYLAYRWEDFVKIVKRTQFIKGVHVGKTCKIGICHTGWNFLLQMIKRGKKVKIIKRTYTYNR